jgi:hypothetical protein
VHMWDRFYLATSVVPLNSATNYKISNMKWISSCKFHFRPFLKYVLRNLKHSSITSHWVSGLYPSFGILIIQEKTAWKLNLWVQ